MKRLQGPQRTVVQLVCVVLIMGGLSWASVPFYNWFCRVTGFGGTPGQVAEGVDHILDQEVTVRFDASVDSEMPWEFKPVETKMKLRIG